MLPTLNPGLYPNRQCNEGAASQVDSELFLLHVAPVAALMLAAATVTVTWGCPSARRSHGAVWGKDPLPHFPHSYPLRSSQTETQAKKSEERVPHPTLEPSSMSQVASFQVLTKTPFSKASPPRLPYHPAPSLPHTFPS